MGRGRGGGAVVGVEVGLLGPVEAWRDGSPVTLGGPRPRALLAVLAMEAGRVCPVDGLVDAVWAGEPPPTATAGLQTYVARLRRALEPDRPAGGEPAVLVRRPGGYALVGATTDVERVEGALARARAHLEADRPEDARAQLGPARAAWRGPPLGDLADRPFAVGLRRRADDLRARLEEAWAEAHLALGDPDPAISALTDLRTRHPWRERPAALLVIALHRAGRREEALAVTTEVRAHLADQAAGGPGPELAAAEREVVGGRPPPVPAAPGPSPTPQGPPPLPPAVATGPLWPLRARDALLGELDRLLAEGTSVVVHGGAGVGATRVLEEAVRRRARSGAGVVAVTADRALAEVALGAFAPVLPVTTTAPGAAEALEQAVAHLAAQGRDQPLVVNVDDGHHLDPVSVELVRRLAAGPATLALTARGEGRPPEPLLRLVRDRVVAAVAVPPLGPADATALVEAHLGGPVQPATAARIWALTHGHPRFVRELVEGTAARGDLVEGDDGWRLAEGASLPPGLVDLVDDEVAATDLVGRLALERVALAGSLPLSVAEDLLGPVVMGGLSESGLLRVDEATGGDEVRCAHPLHTAVLRSTTPRSRRRTHAGAVADALGAEPSQPSWVVRAAMIRLDAGDLGPEDSARAWAAAGASFDLDQARRLATVAGPPPPGPAPHRVRPAAGPSDLGTDILPALRRARSDAERTEVVLLAASGLAAGADRTEEAIALLDEAGGEVTDPSFGHQIELLRVELAAARVGAPEAAAAGLASRGELTEGHWRRAHNALATGFALAASGQLDRASPILASVINGEVVIASDVHRMRNLALRCHHYTLLVRGELAAAERLSDLQSDVARRVDPAATALWQSARGVTLACQGRLAEARAHLEAALVGLAHGDPYGLRRANALHLAMVLGQAGHAIESEDWIAQADRQLSGPDPGRATHGLRACDRASAEAWWAAAAGRPDEAVDRARAGAEVARSCGVDPGVLGCLQVALRCGAVGVAAEVEALPRLRGGLADLVVRHSRCRDAGDGEGLLAVSEDYEVAWYHLSAAEAAAEATALTGATAAAERARRLLRRWCPSARTPALAGLATGGDDRTAPA